MTDTHDPPIPPAVVEAMARAAHDEWRRQASVGDDIAEYEEWDNLSRFLKDEYREQATAALRAGLAAWPGMSHAHNEEGEIKDWAIWYALPWHRAETSNGIILPLTENSNDKA